MYLLVAEAAPLKSPRRPRVYVVRSPPDAMDDEERGVVEVGREAPLDELFHPAAISVTAVVAASTPLPILLDPEFDQVEACM
jgi:hypothetical protein